MVAFLTGRNDQYIIDSKSLKQDFPVHLELVKAVDYVNVSYLNKHYNQQITRASDVDVSGKTIICRNHLHCYATKQYLRYMNFTGVEEIYLVG